MSVPLDTHAALWYALGDMRLSNKARNAIDGENDRRLLSPVSYWEIAIKIRLGDYALDEPFSTFWNDALVRCGYAILPIEIKHAEKVTTLPFHHRDPFDRMLVAQAQCENFPLVSNDSRLDDYGI